MLGVENCNDVALNREKREVMYNAVVDFNGL